MVYAPFKQIESSLHVIESVEIALCCELCWVYRVLNSMSCFILVAVNAPKPGKKSRKLTKNP